MLKFVTLAALAGFAATAVQAEDYAVNEIRYRNQGSYLATVAIVYKAPTSNSLCLLTVKKQLDAEVTQGEAQTFKLGNQNAYKLTSDQPAGCSVNIPQGSEVWATFGISAPPVDVFLNMYDMSGCRKDNAKFFYYPKGGTVSYFSKGTAKQNNRCQLKTKGGVKVSSLSN